MSVNHRHDNVLSCILDCNYCKYECLSITDMTVIDVKVVSKKNFMSYKEDQGVFRLL